MRGTMGRMSENPYKSPSPMPPNDSGRNRRRLMFYTAAMLVGASISFFGFGRSLIGIGLLTIVPVCLYFAFKMFTCHKCGYRVITTTIPMQHCSKCGASFDEPTPNP